MLGSYQIVEQIGRGGMATVYKAFQASLSRYVAIKILPPARADDATFLERFHREAVVVASLRHPNILVVFDSNKHDDLTYSVSELMKAVRWMGVWVAQCPSPKPSRFCDLLLLHWTTRTRTALSIGTSSQALN